MTFPPPQSLAGDLRQLASVRRIVLDDGPERGVRALAFSTGGGLDFWVLVDRSLDIGPLWYRGVPVAWQSPSGFRSPYLHDAERDRGLGFNRSFSGFLITCGLDHIRQPSAGHPLHGRFPFTPARLTAYGEDWDRPDPLLYCEGEIIQSRHGGEAIRLRRRIEAGIGANTVAISDRVDNIGPESCEHALLYHFNVGYPAIADGTEIFSGADRVVGPLTVPNPEDRPPARTVPADCQDEATCLVRTPTADGQTFEVSFTYSANSLPFLQLWRDLRPRVGVVSIEPCTAARPADGGPAAVQSLSPGEGRSYRVVLNLRGIPPMMMLG